MLVLSRRPGEQIMIGSNIVLEVLELSGGRVRLGISAPNEVRIVREELLENRPANVYLASMSNIPLSPCGV